jgi:Copper transport outer membrane protein, MctB
MINFRFHIVSLTAVLLALGIGLMLGTTFLDTATVDALRDRQDDLESDIAAARERSGELTAQLDSYEEEAEAFDEQLGPRIFPGQLTDVPVLVLSTRGVDEGSVDRVTNALTLADADLLGTWWLTDRLRLEDDNEVSDLGDALQLSTDDVDRLRSTLAGQLGDVLFAASDAPGPGEGLEGEADPAAEPPATEAGEGAEGGEPPVLARLREAGFVEYEMPDGSDEEVIVLPAEGLRLVIVSGPEASVPPSDLVVPVLIEYSFGGPVPALAAEPTIVVPEDGEDEPPESLVIDIRQDEDLVDRVSTVDDLDRVPGLVATVLALADADPAFPPVPVGHYGSGEGASLLPPEPEAPE